jgi:hypothetical protein
VEFLSVFGVLAQRRMLVAFGMLLALLVGAMAAGMLPVGPGSTPGAPSGLAQTRVLVDHPQAVLPDTSEISDTVGKQAALLADLISGDAQRDAIAQRAGIPAAQLGMQRMQLAQLLALGQQAERAAKVSAGVARPYVVNVWAASPLPVLTIDVVAPTATGAARVVGATRATLEALVAERAPSAGHGIVIKPLGDGRAADVPADTPSKRVALAAAIAFFIFWSCAVVVLTGLQRAWRNAVAAPGSADAGLAGS